MSQEKDVSPDGIRAAHKVFVKAASTTMLGNDGGKPLPKSTAKQSNSRLNAASGVSYSCEPDFTSISFSVLVTLNPKPSWFDTNYFITSSFSSPSFPRTQQDALLLQHLKHLLFLEVVVAAPSLVSIQAIKCLHLRMHRSLAKQNH